MLGLKVAYVPTQTSSALLDSCSLAGVRPGLLTSGVHYHTQRSQPCRHPLGELTLMDWAMLQGVPVSAPAGHPHHRAQRAAWLRLAPAHDAVGHERIPAAHAAPSGWSATGAAAGGDNMLLPRRISPAYVSVTMLSALAQHSNSPSMPCKQAVWHSPEGSEPGSGTRACQPK